MDDNDRKLYQEMLESLKACHRENARLSADLKKLNTDLGSE